MPRKHYTPPLSRFVVCALFHQAKVRSIPMTQLANEIMQAGLKDSPGWKQARAQQETMRMASTISRWSLGGRPRLRRPANVIGTPERQMIFFIRSQSGSDK